LYKDGQDCMYHLLHPRKLLYFLLWFLG